MKKKKFSSHLYEKIFSHDTNIFLPTQNKKNNLKKKKCKREKKFSSQKNSLNRVTTKGS